METSDVLVNREPEFPTYYTSHTLDAVWFTPRRWLQTQGYHELEVDEAIDVAIRTLEAYEQFEGSVRAAMLSEETLHDKLEFAIHKLEKFRKDGIMP